MKTSFQRLLRGLNVLNRYSGITDVGFNLDTETQQLGVFSTSPVMVGVTIPVPVSLKLDPKDVAALTKLGWHQDSQSWVFQP